MEGESQILNGFICKKKTKRRDWKHPIISKSLVLVEQRLWVVELAWGQEGKGGVGNKISLTFLWDYKCKNLYTKCNHVLTKEQL